MADVSIGNKDWNIAKEWTQEHAATAAVVCAKIYDWVNWEDSPKPKQLECYRAWFPIGSLTQMIEEACSQIRDPAFGAAVHIACGAAVGLALAYEARDKEGKHFYFTYLRDTRHTHTDWSGKVWTRPACPAPGLRQTGPPDVMISYSGTFGRY